MQFLSTKTLYMCNLKDNVTQVTDFQKIQNTIKLIFAIYLVLVALRYQTIRLPMKNTSEC